MNERAYNQILMKELIPAVGCTEPIAIAMTAARARDLLGAVPERIEAVISGDIIKNAKSVIVPNSGGLYGIDAAIAIGIAAGQAGRQLEALSEVSDAQREEMVRYMQAGRIHVSPSESGHVFEIDMTAYSGQDWARVRVLDAHTNIVYEEKNGEILLEKKTAAGQDPEEELYKLLNVADIIRFVEEADLSEIRPYIERQLQYNLAIADEGIRGEYGARIGKTFLKTQGNRDVRVLAKARAAAGSDARMSGSIMPVVVVSGSGNQGITASVPVEAYASRMHASHEQLIQAVVLSDLIAVYLKHDMGKLSAFCGALCAGIGAGCGIAYLKGGREEVISHVITNSIGILSGMICDGAKPSCAAKIAYSVDSAIFAMEMYENGQEFEAGDGIVSYDADRTVSNITRLGSVGLKGADTEILKMMLECQK